MSLEAFTSTTPSSLPLQQKPSNEASSIVAQSRTASEASSALLQASQIIVESSASLLSQARPPSTDHALYQPKKVLTSHDTLPLMNTPITHDSTSSNTASQDPQEPLTSEQKYTLQKALSQKVNLLEVTMVASHLDSRRDSRDKSKWRVPGKGVISINGNQWFHFEGEQGGHGAISFTAYVQNFSRKEAVAWLASTFGSTVNLDELQEVAYQRPEKKAFSPPVKIDKNIHFVRHYLKFTRKIPEHIIDNLIQQGRIYADDQRNCVFFSEGIAEIRSSFDGSDAIKKLAPGSTRQKAFTVLPDPLKNEQTLGLCEAAIDSMSYNALFPGRSAISSSGANPAFARAIAEEAVDKGLSLAVAFDADPTGDRVSQSVFNHFYVKLWLKSQTEAELGTALDDTVLFDLLHQKIVQFHVISPRLQALHSHADSDSLEDYDNEAEHPDDPHLLFFNQEDPFSNPDKPPVILLTIKENPYKLPVCYHFPLPVKPEAFYYIQKALGIFRHRPPGGKDWNEILKNQSADLTPPSASPDSSSSPRKPSF